MCVIISPFQQWNFIPNYLFAKSKSLLIIYKFIIMKSSKLIISLLAGVAGGALFGILFAPDKGYITRQKLAEKADDLTDNVKENLQSFFDNAVECLKKTKEENTNLSDETQEESEKWKEEVSSLS